MTITTDAAQIFRDKQGSALWNPRKSEIRQLFADVDSTKAERSPSNVALVAGVNAQATIADADSPILDVSEYYNAIDFGGFWKSSGLTYVGNSFSHAGQTQAGHTFVSESAGSGANGPANSTFAVGALSYKTDWQTSLASGEVDTFYLNMRQGISSDGGGILNSGKKVTAHGVGVAEYVADGVETQFETDGVIPVTIPGNIVNWPVAVFVTDDTGKHRVFAGVTLTRDSGTGIGTVTFDVAPDDEAAVEIYETNRRTLYTANGSQSAFVTTFAIPGPIPTDLTIGDVAVFLNNIRQTRKTNNDPDSTGAGYVVTRDIDTGLATVTFYDTSGVLAPPTAAVEVKLELSYDGGVTTNEWNAYDLVTWGIGAPNQITYTKKKVQGVTGFIEGYDGFRTNAMGQWQEAQAGNIFAAYHCATADGSFGTAGSSPFYDWILYFETARPVAPQARTTYQAFGIFGNGTKMLMGPAGVDRKYISADGGSLKIRDSIDANTLLEVQEDGDVRTANNVLIGGGFIRPQMRYTAAFLNAAVAEYEPGDAVVCSDARGGKSGWVERTEDGWRIMGTTTAIPA